jgi:UDP-2,3-diacylglucosamine pyrophosphatase LpxH
VGHALHEPRGQGNEALVAAQRAWARGLLARGEAQLVVCGHSHTPLLEALDGHGLWLNTGDFVGHLTFGELTDGQVRLRAWSAEGPSRVIAARPLRPA